MKQRKNLTLAAYDRILEMMINYDIVPGQRLVFVDLAEQLGVSRTPVNNALSILAKEGYLDFIPNQGYTVHKITREEADALYEIREILEIGTISKAIRAMTPEMIERFKSKKEAYEKAITDRVHRGLFILDTDFHAAVIEMIGNALLVDRYRDLCKRIFLRFRVETLSIDRVHDIVREHEELFEAICIRDVDLAKELLKKHNRNARKNLFSIIFGDSQKDNKIK
ncbi:MAG: GntR family transcriptional regulator [Desulfobacteraceae bacterium]